jgi:hypothetical protein
VTDTSAKPQRGVTLRHVPDQLYFFLGALKDAEVPEGTPEPVKGWNNALSEIYVLAVHSTGKKPLKPKTAQQAIWTLQSALRDAFIEHPEGHDPVTLQEWEAIALALDKAGQIAESAARGG